MFQSLGLLAAGAVYAGLVMTYAGIVVLAGESAANAGTAGLTMTLLLPFTAFLATLTAAASGGWLLVCCGPTQAASGPTLVRTTCHPAVSSTTAVPVTRRNGP